MHRIQPAIFSIVILLLAVGSVRAAVDDTFEQLEDAAESTVRKDLPPIADRRIPPLRLQLDEEITWNDFKKTDVTAFRTKLTGTVILPFSERFVTILSTTGGVTHTNFDGRDDFIYIGQRSSDPWDDLYEFTSRIRGMYKIDDHWGAIGAAWISARFEEGASFGDGMKGAGALGASYSFGDNLTVSGGVAVASRIVGSSVAVNPFVQFAWQIDDVHELATSGLGLRLRSKWNRSITTYAYGRFKGRRWRLDDREDGIVDKGSLRDRQAPIGVGVQWKFLKYWRLRGDFGLIVYRQLKVTNEDDDTVDTRASRAPGVFGGLTLRWRF
jgi:hypothetical protein